MLTASHIVKDQSLQYDSCGFSWCGILVGSEVWELATSEQPLEYQLPKGADKKNQLGFLVQMKMILSYLASEYDIIESKPDWSKNHISDQHQRPLVALFKKHWQVCLSGDRFELLFTTSPPGIWCHQPAGGLWWQPQFQADSHSGDVNLETWFQRPSSKLKSPSKLKNHEVNTYIQNVSEKLKIDPTWSYFCLSWHKAKPPPHPPSHPIPQSINPSPIHTQVISTPRVFEKSRLSS